ncbi:MAG TPA: amino acid adenylation domain-containing protein [Thermoanaerobaculia bacterium]|nr:amino acid adenylation domain-containing protein [Thermoanaerobaculia bacterium]
MFMTLLAAWNTLLFRVSEQTDLVVGIPIANRNRLETEGLIGFFTNTLALRTRLTAGERFLDLVRDVREEALQAYSHQNLPFECLVEELAPERSLAHTPLFQVMFSLQNMPLGELTLPGLTLSPRELPRQTAKFDLSLFLVEAGEELLVTLEFAADLFDAVTADRFLERFRILVEDAIANPQRSLAELTLLPACERHQVLCEWNDVTAGGGSLCIHRLVEAQARRTPGAAAVLSTDMTEISYRDLDDLAERLAHRLRELGVRPDDHVGVCLERSWEAVVALLAILKAGGCFLPLDSAYPRERLGLMLADAAAPVIVTRDRLAAALPPHHARVLSLDAKWPEPAGEGDLPDVGPEHLAYAIFTSGSTGRPKGVILPHRTLANLIAWQVAASAAPAGRTLQFASASFDVSLQEILATWAAGGTLVLLSEEARSDVEALLRRLGEARVERLFLPFVALQQLAEAASGAAGELPPLREVITAGEQLQATPAVRALFARLPGCVLRNQYGPSETHVVTEFSLGPARPGEVEDWPALPPIGRPIAATEVHLLDPRGLPVPIGVPGEIYLGGAGLARGYLGDPGRTAERFVPTPWGQGGRLYRTGDLARRRPSGEIEFLGRIDHQVKIRGFRVELGEIEAALAAHPAVREAVVVARGEGAGKRLVAYVLPATAESGPGDLLRVHLRESLPDYMVPAVFVPVESFPLTSSGKLDRRRLAVSGPEPRETASRGAAPRTPTEELLAGIWAEVLGLERVGIHDGFFDLGGHSLLATRAVSRLRCAFGIELPLRVLFERPSVAALAELLDALARHEAQAEALPVEPERPAPIAPRPADAGDPPVSFSQEQLWFIDRLEPGSPVYNLPTAVRLDGLLDRSALRRALAQLVERQAVLRTTLGAAAGRPIQVVAPHLVPALPEVDLTALGLAVREAAATRLVAAEALLPFDLAAGPLFRATLLRLEVDRHLLPVTFHHSITDGWSLRIFYEELGALYVAAVAGREADLPALPVQYTDFASWQRERLRGDLLNRLLAYWRQRLAGAPAALDMPFDRPRPPVQTYGGTSQFLEVGAEAAQALRTFARGENVTLFMTLIAAWATLVRRLTGKHDVVIGTPTANRSHPELEPLLGFFANVMPLRVDLSGDPTFRELVGRVRTAALADYTHQEMPFEKIVEELKPERDLSHHPIYQVVLALETSARPDFLDLPGLRISPLRATEGTAKFDLALYMDDRGGRLTGLFETNRDLVDRSTAARWLGHFAALAAAGAGDPARRLSELPFLGAAERHQLLVEAHDARGEIYVLDRTLAPVPLGVPGEIHAGVLDSGPLDLAGVSAESFVPHPFAAVPGARLVRTGDFARVLPSGVLEVLGRVDQRVKVRGYRIDLWEVEAVLAGHPQIDSAVVTLRTVQPGQEQLVAYVVTRPELSAPDAETLRGFLGERLPEYMRPGTLVFLPEMPLTAEGRVDRCALPVPQERSDPGIEPAAPVSEAEGMVFEIWQELLGVERVGADDNFFALGGRSLLLLPLQERLQERFGVKVPVVELFKFPTAGSLASHLHKAQEGSRPAEPERQATKVQERADRSRAGVGQGRFAEARRRVQATSPTPSTASGAFFPGPLPAAAVADPERDSLFEEDAD